MSLNPTRRRLNTLSWASPFLATAIIAFLFTSSIGQGQAPIYKDARVRTLIGPSTSRASQLICTVSAFFSIDANEQAADVIRVEGRGLATCKNDQGFTTDVPVTAEVDARAVGNWANAGELSLSANSSPFIVNREVGQLSDAYSVKSFASDVNDKASPTVLFQGAKHDLMIEMKFSSSTDALQKIEITGMNLRFDESAPTLE